MNTYKSQWCENTRLLYDKFRNFCNACEIGTDFYNCTADSEHRQICESERRKFKFQYLDVVDTGIYAVIVTDGVVRHIFKTGFHCGDAFTEDEVKNAYYDLFDRLSGDNFIFIRGLHRAQEFEFS